MATTGNATTRRRGFTLIELLIVIVIIGILAAIAIPRLGNTRERAYFKAIMSDLRNLQSQQELYYGLPQNAYNYATVWTDLPDFKTSSGVTVQITAAGGTGWAATGSHAGLRPTQTCAVYAGSVSSVPAPASTPGVVTCTGE